ncbi:HD domain-containing phosphohydrolase [Clostridium sp. JN-9]|uniref:HD domain-containing phosphohydrolase n=1 Tax=Clostridium sp. JN-9 TaxID=2507159 RepID=UPI000FFE3152|nr:HD domain-containing phosphohydrolase [Clostridium sp. JN-9]QAT39279.1 HD domain-containing protein [Clostridium sp. JN-9]
MDNINLFQLISAFSTSIDFAETGFFYDDSYLNAFQSIKKKNGKFTNHSKRTAYVAERLSKQISSDSEFLKKAFFVTSLHDIGASFYIEEAHSDKVQMYKHSVKGSTLIKNFPFMDEEASLAVKYHHENYDGSGHFGLTGNEIPILAQIIRTADAFDVLYDDDKNNFTQRKHIAEWMNKKKDVIFNPHLIDIFIDVQSKDRFWLDVENIGVNPKIISDIIPEVSLNISWKELRDIAWVFADIIDSKSPFTYTHSSGLAKLINKISGYLNCDEEKRTKLEAAALLHDIGKLRIPNSILNKPGKLTDDEYTVIRSHTYYTRYILSQVDGLSEITDWAANHHEKLDGSGYPLGISGSSLSKEERLMGVCDMYQALTENRPYRPGMSEAKAFSILDDSVNKGKISGEAVNVLKKVVKS